jgi:hypothetical protein
MCNSYCNSCNYCVSQCTCSNPTLVTPASIPATGCISTNYARCVYFSGNNISCGSISITNGQNLDVVIKTLSDSICNITPADLAWGTFNYQCLRENGSLTSSGPSNITTGKEFAEAVSIALCNLATAVDVTPNITISGPCSTYFAGLIPGTSTLVNILDDFIVKLCALNAQNDTSTVTTACSAGLWTSVPAYGSTLGTWVNWIKTNVCSLVTTLQGRVTALETFETNLKTFVGDPTLSLIDNSTSCISGSGSDTLLTTIGLIKTKLCAINTTVSAYPNFAAITLPWTSCPGLFPSYSSTASLTTHLTRIVNEIAARTYGFSSDFTVTATACGTTVGLAAPGGFTCGDLATCSIKNLGDVDPSFSVSSQFAVLSWNGAGQWTSKVLSLTSAGGTCAITSTSSPNLGFNIEANIATAVTAATLGTPVSLSAAVTAPGTTTVTLSYDPNYFVSVGVITLFSYAPATAVLSVGASTTGPPTTLNTLQGTIKNGNEIRIEGQIDLVVSGGGLAAGTQYTLGTFALPTSPTSGITYWSSAYSVMDNAAPGSYPLYVGYNAASGTLSIYTLGAIAAATYTLSLSGFVSTY